MRQQTRNYKRESHLRIQEFRRINGLCRKCGGGSGGKYRCRKCQDEVNEANYRRVARNKAVGLCACGRDRPEPGRGSCKLCLDWASENQKRLQAERLAVGLCRYCNYWPLPGTQRCYYCTRNHARLAAESYDRNKTLVLEHYSPICYCCGSATWWDLEPDHLNNDGHLHGRTRISDAWKWIIDNGFPDDIGIACANCNYGRGRWKICPHISPPKEPSNSSERSRFRQRLRVINAYGGVCACCGEANWALLELDHRNDDGKTHRELLGGVHVEDWLVKNCFGAQSLQVG